jgi:hypothetical protein
MQKIIGLLILLSIGCAKDAPLPDPCLDKICANGGVCEDGTCNCAPHWTGENCTEQITPLLITVQGIEVLKFPPTDNGAGWDINSGPDVYVIIRQNGTIIGTTQNAWIQNATGNPYWNSGFSTNLALQQITIEMWDYDDFDSDDYMGGIIGYIYTNTSGFPVLVTLECPTCPVHVRLGPMEYL